MARIFLPKMWRGGAKIEWRGAAVVLMRWRVRANILAEKTERWCNNVKSGARRGARTKKSGARPALVFCEVSFIRC